MKTLLITGASGFIGSFMVEEGLKRGYQVFAGIRKSSSKGYLTDSRIRFLEFDFSSVEQVERTLEESEKNGISFDFIIHNAGVTKTRTKEEFYDVNCRNTRNFMEGLRKAGMIPQKFVYMSSLAAYGPGDPVTGTMVKLEDPPRPIELYGISKLEAEKYIRTQEDFPWLIFRPTGVYGPKEKDYFVFFQTINRGLEPSIGFREQVLTFIYVRDLVRVIVDSLESEHVRKAWFVNDGREYSSGEFAAITKRALGKRCTLKIKVPLFLVKGIATAGEWVGSLTGNVPTLNADKYRVLSSTNWRCDGVPLQRDLNFTAEYDLERGVKEAIAWYKAQGWL